MDSTDGAQPPTSNGYTKQKPARRMSIGERIRLFEQASANEQPRQRSTSHEPGGMPKRKELQRLKQDQWLNNLQAHQRKQQELQYRQSIKRSDKMLRSIRPVTVACDIELEPDTSESPSPSLADHPLFATISRRGSANCTPVPSPYPVRANHDAVPKQRVQKALSVPTQHHPLATEEEAFQELQTRPKRLLSMPTPKLHVPPPSPVDVSRTQPVNLPMTPFSFLSNGLFKQSLRMQQQQQKQQQKQQSPTRRKSHSPFHTVLQIFPITSSTTSLENIPSPSVREAIELRDDAMVFGSTLSEIAKQENNDGPPEFVVRCIDAIEKRDGFKARSLYSKNAKERTVKQLCVLVNRRDEYDFMDTEWDLTVLTNGLKRFFRELKEALITNDFYRQVADVLLTSDKKEKLEVTRALLKELPSCHLKTLELLIQHLHRVSIKTKSNGMEPKTLASIFGPILIRSSNELDSDHRNPIVEFLITESEDIFSSIFETAVFGLTLCHLAQRENDDGPPQFIIRCIDAIERRGGLLTEGIYRRDGRKVAITELRSIVDRGDEYDLMDTEWDLTVVTSGLKLFFRELKEALIPIDFYRKVTDVLKRKERVEATKNLLKELPSCHFKTLELLMQHLHRVAENCSENKMDSRNISIVFAPTVVHCHLTDTNAMDLGQQQKMVEFMITLAEQLFPSTSPRPHSDGG